MVEESYQIGTIPIHHACWNNEKLEIDLVEQYRECKISS